MLEENKVEIIAASEDTKMLAFKMEELDDVVRMITQAVRVRMLKRMATEEAGGEEEPSSE